MRLGGDSYYDSPDRTGLRLTELYSKQQLEARDRFSHLNVSKQDTGSIQSAEGFIDQLRIADDNALVRNNTHQMKSRPLIGVKHVDKTAFKTGINSKDDSLYEPSVTFGVGQAPKLPKLNFGGEKQWLNHSVYSTSAQNKIQKRPFDRISMNEQASIMQREPAAIFVVNRSQQAP